MTGTLEFLYDIHAIQLCLIGLSNGSNTVGNFEGTIKWGSKFLILNVLYVPNLKCNLISILQLLHFNPTYGVYFSKKFCVIQDHFLKKEIGQGRLLNRVYNFS